MTQPVSIGLAKSPEPNKEVVELLEEALERAKKGETTGLLMLEQEGDGVVSYSIAGIKDRFKVTGYMYHAIFKLQNDKSDA